MDIPTPRRHLRRRWKILAGLLILALVVVAALPWILETGFGRSRIRDGLNRAFAPGKVEFESIELGWFRPTRLSKVILFDPNGKVVARVPFAVVDKSLANFLLPGRSPVLLTLDETALDVARSETGLIDLSEALKTIVSNPDPNRDLTIRIERGTLSYRDPFLAEASTADAADLTLRIPSSPNPITWSLKLEKKEARLEIQGDFDRWLAKGGVSKSPELQVGVVGKQWPFVAKVAEIDAVGKMDGTLDFSRKRGKWVLSGDARLDGLRAQGKPLEEDVLEIERLVAGWELVQAPEGWTIRRLGLNCPLGDLKTEGDIQSETMTGKQRIEGKLDLAAIARQLPHALRLREGLSVERGSARLAVDLEWNRQKTTYDIEARVSDLAAKDHDRTLSLREPAKLVARLIMKGRDSSVERLSVETSFLQASMNGKFEGGVKLEAKLDLDAFRNQLSEWVELRGLEMAGKVVVNGWYLVHPAGSPYFAGERIESIRETPFTGTWGLVRYPYFYHETNVKVHDLRLNGTGGPPIKRDLITLNATANGPVDRSGLPKDWSAFFVKVQSGDLEARLRLDPGDGKTIVTAAASLPISATEHPTAAKFDMIGDWSGTSRTLTFAEIAAEVVKNTPVKVVPPVAEAVPTEVPEILVPAEKPVVPDRPWLVRARGKLDLPTGELTLDPIAGESIDAIQVAPDGLRISGLGKGLDALRFDGGLTGEAEKLDPLIADLTGRAPLGLSGRWSAVASGRSEGDGLRLAARLGMVDSSASAGKPVRPTSLAANALYSSKLDRLDVAEFAVTTAYGSLDASGRLDEPMGTCKVNLNGKLAPDFAAITALLVAKVEPGAKIDGRPRSFRASGTLGDSLGGWKGLDAEFGFDLVETDIYGMKFGATPVVLRSKLGKLTFDPISTSINEGHLRLEPELDLDAPGGPTLRLAKNSNIREAKINDEVSKRVLAYVAPILDQTTRASGLVSVDLDHAEFPIGPGRGRQAKLEGAVVFQDVEFAPGPLAGEILGAIGRRDLSLKLDQPVTLTIADGRINQRGMTLPIGDLTRIELSGWVDFDRKLGLVATVPVTSAMLGNNALLADIAAGTKVRLPISGTLDKPVIDREAFADNLQELGKTLLTRGATRGALELLMRLGRPKEKDPDAPPPPPRLTPDQRKSQRQEKKAIRRGELPPPTTGIPKD